MFFDVLEIKKKKFGCSEIVLLRGAGVSAVLHPAFVIFKIHQAVCDALAQPNASCDAVVVQIFCFRYFFDFMEALTTKSPSRGSSSNLICTGISTRRFV